MRFEPRIVRSSEPELDPAIENWSDEQFEATLPGDLEALAAQLRDDATHLSAKYPARGEEVELAVPSEASPAPRAGERKRTASATLLWLSAGTLASVAMVAAALPWMFPSDSREGSKATVENVVSTPGVEPVGRDLVPSHLAHAPADSIDTREAARGTLSPTPVLFLQNVSGPELEGLFDLWEADAVEQSRISI